MFFDWFHFWVDSQTVLSQPPGNTWHVRRFPCKNVPILTNEYDELAFLFGIHPSPNGELLRRVARDKINLLCQLKFKSADETKLVDFTPRDSSQQFSISANLDPK